MIPEKIKVETHGLKCGDSYNIGGEPCVILGFNQFYLYVSSGIHNTMGNQMPIFNDKGLLLYPPQTIQFCGCIDSTLFKQQYKQWKKL